MKQRSFGTHDGSFHADEVTACALLLVFNRIDRDKIVRTRIPDVLDACEYVCDVGGIYDAKLKRFDHHQVDYTGELASAGMIWRYLYEEKEIDRELFIYLNHSIIMGIDAHDNGKVVQHEGVCTFSHVVANFVPTAYDAGPDALDDAFFAALDFAVGHFTRVIERYNYTLACKQEVEEVMKMGREVLIFDRPLPWQENFFQLNGEKHPALFVIMPAGEHWKLRGIPPNRKEKMDVRLPMPDSWAGLRDEELSDESGIPGAIFCHKGRFISVWETKEAAMAALEKVLSMAEEKQ